MSLEIYSSEEEILHLIEAKSKGMHRCLNGRLVKVGTKTCQQDILKRMEDIHHHRDSSDYGSDARVYFSGVLRILRKKLRENDKLMVPEEQKKKPEKKKLQEGFDSISSEASSRLLRLSGII